MNCHRCGGSFSPSEWDERHSDWRGEDIHADCCERHGPCSDEDSDLACPDELILERALT